MAVSPSQSAEILWMVVVLMFCPFLWADERATGRHTVGSRPLSGSSLLSV